MALFNQRFGVEDRKKEHTPLVVFLLDDRRYALYLHTVERILRAVDVTPLPKAPDIVLGLINVRGNVTPVLDVRKRFRLKEREIGLQDHLIVARTSKRTVVIPVDSTNWVIEVPNQEVIDAKGLLPGVDYVQGVVKLQDGIVLIHDLESFLSLEEEKTLEAAIKERP